MAQDDDILKIIEGLKTQLADLSQKYKALRQEKAGEIKQNASGTTPSTANNNAAPPSEPSAEAGQQANNSAGGSGIPTTLSGSVGRGGQNAEADVRAVQQRLGRNGIEVEADGKMGPQTQGAIERFQQHRIGNATGLIEPDSDTWKALMGQQVARQEPSSNNAGNASSNATAGGGGQTRALLNSITVTGAGDKTTRQDGLQGRGLTGVQVSQRMAATDAQKINQHKQLFVKVGKEFGIPPAILAALASRETRGVDTITGDGGNGIGYLQVDKRYHPAAAQAIINKPAGPARVEEGIRQGAIIFKRFWDEMKRKFPQWPAAQQLKGAIAAYNAGPGNVRTIENMDKGTTGDDYSSDVWARAMYFMEQGYAEDEGGQGNESNQGNANPSSNANAESNNAPATNNTNAGAIPTSLTGSVGQGGQNAEVDVRAVQQRLARHGIQIEADGKIGPQTIAAIERFQTAKIGVADGRVDPGGDTWKALMGQNVPRREAPAASTTFNGQYNAALGQEVAASARREAQSRGTVGRCYNAVADAVERVMGPSIFSGNSAFMAAGQMAALPNLFKEVSASPSSVAGLPAGAIVVWAAGGGPHEVHGHISVSLGDGREASDHIAQQYAWPGGRVRAFLPLSKK